MDKDNKSETQEPPMTAPSELMPKLCETCGKEPYLHETDWTDPPTWTCYCFCLTKEYDTREEAIAAWNRRHVKDWL